MEKGELMILIGNNVRRYRMERKMTQEELASLIGKNSSAIARIEGGTRMMSIPTLRSVAEVLNVSCDALLQVPGEGTGQENICHLLADQSGSSLRKLEKVLQLLVEIYGEKGGHSCGI